MLRDCVFRHVLAPLLPSTATGKERNDSTTYPTDSSKDIVLPLVVAVQVAEILVLLILTVWDILGTELCLLLELRLLNLSGHTKKLAQFIQRLLALHHLLVYPLTPSGKVLVELVGLLLSHKLVVMLDHLLVGQVVLEPLLVLVGIELPLLHPLVEVLTLSLEVLVELLRSLLEPELPLLHPLLEVLSLACQLLIELLLLLAGAELSCT